MFTCENRPVAMSSPDVSPPPPDSWPGAGGRRSVAPDVPAWPGAAPRSADGDSWPGASRRDSWPGATRRAGATISDLDEVDDHEGGVAAILFPAVSGLILLALVGLWVFLDDSNRALQMNVLVVVVLVALLALGVSAYRHRRR